MKVGTKPANQKIERIARDDIYLLGGIIFCFAFSLCKCKTLARAHFQVAPGRYDETSNTQPANQQFQADSAAQFIKTHYT